MPAIAPTLHKDFLVSLVKRQYDHSTTEKLTHSFLEGYELGYDDLERFMKGYPTHLRGNFVHEYTTKAMQLIDAIKHAIEIGDVSQTALYTGKIFAWMFFTIEKVIFIADAPISLFANQFALRGMSLEETAEACGTIVRTTHLLIGMDHIHAQMLEVAERTYKENTHNTHIVCTIIRPIESTNCLFSTSIKDLEL